MTVRTMDKQAGTVTPNIVFFMPIRDLSKCSECLIGLIVLSMLICMLGELEDTPPLDW